MGWVLRTGTGAAVTGIATCLVALLSGAVVPRPAGHTAVKLTMAVQFVGLLGYLVGACWAAAPVACRTSLIIFTAYAPGLLLYALKWPSRSDFGFHELFHSSVLLGHATSMVCDLRDVLQPCARCAGAAGHALVCLRPLLS